MNKKPWQEFILKVKGTKSINSLAKELGMSFGAVNAWLKGRSIPSEDALGKIAEYTGIPVAQILEEYEVPDISTYMSELSQKNKLKLMDESKDSYEIVEVPFYGTAGCGNAHNILGQPIDSIPRKQSDLKRLYGKTTGLIYVEASGDSMIPYIQDGALVLVDTENTQLKDGVFLLVDYDSALIKRCIFGLGGKVSIVSDNPISRSQDFSISLADIDTMFTIIGRVRASEMMIT